MVTAPVPDPSQAPRTGLDADRVRVRRVALVSTLRVLVVTVALVAVYVVAPIGEGWERSFVARLALVLLVLAAVLTWQIRAILRSPHPTLRGIEAVAICVPVLVLAFATAYVGTEYTSPGSFTEDLTRLDAVYLSVTILATVGFGDITPRSDVARLLVTAQMLVDIVLVGLVARVLVAAVRRRRDALQADRPAASP